jgi:hypothetical protein
MDTTQGFTELPVSTFAFMPFASGIQQFHLIREICEVFLARSISARLLVPVRTVLRISLTPVLVKLVAQ